MAEAEALAAEVVRSFTLRGRTFAAAESCTGGLTAALVTRIPGASRVLWGSYVTYTAEAKTAMLGVGEEIIRTYGAVSRETASAMAGGVLERSGADMAVAITGLAGPGDEPGLPAGTVWIASALRGGETGARLFRFPGARNEVRLAAAKSALEELLNLLFNGKPAGR
jgi:PncC family amidohydrolase